MRVKAVSGVMLSLLLASMLASASNIQLAEAAAPAHTTLAEQIMASLGAIADWTATDNLEMQGIVFNKNTKSVYNTMVTDAHTDDDWRRVIAYSRIAEVDGYWTDTIEMKLKDALDGMTFFTNYSLPKNYPWPDPTDFGALRSYDLAGYRYAHMLNTSTDDWDPDSGFEGLKRMWDDCGHPFYFGNPDTPSETSMYGGRWYMCGFLMDCFRYFWQANVSRAWVYMNVEWDYLNLVHWSGTHYSYAPEFENWEKTVYPPYMSITKFYIENGRKLEWWDRLLTDIQNRYLTGRWESPQWYDTVNKYYAAIHHSPGNKERLIDDTLAAWYFLHMFYGYFSSSNQEKMRDLLEGYTGEDPAWKSLLESPYPGLFIPEENSFRKSSRLDPSDEATACGVLTLILQGISPQSGRGLALPVFDPVAWSLYSAWPFSDSFNFDADNRKLTIPVWKGTTLKFLYGSSPFNETFNYTGIWECTFASDWNSITSKKRISPLILEDHRYEYLHLPVYNINSNRYYTTIQEAIDAHETSDEDIIFVEAGTYYEHVIVNKSVSLIGENRSTTIIDGNGTGTVVSITADNVVISEFTIQNSGSWVNGYGVGIFVSSSCNIIAKNVISNNYYGMRLNGLNNTINNNMIISNYRDGVFLDGSNNNIITGNIVSNNENNGVYLLWSGNNTLRNNNLTCNRYDLNIWGTSLSDFIQDIDISNIVDEKPIYYWVNETNKSIPANAGYVAAINSTNIVVENLNLTKNFQGLLLAYTTDSLVKNMTLTNNYVGISLVNSTKNTISSNSMTVNEIGIQLRGNSRHNTIIGNSVEHNANGIDLWQSNDNTICHNNFISNWKYPIYRSGINTWDNGYEGNYWNNYNGTDLNGDGIGDTYLPWEEVDYYPLMNPYIRGDVNHDGEIDILDIKLVKLAYSKVIEYPYADLDGNGVINILDLKIEKLIYSGIL